MSGPPAMMAAGWQFDAGFHGVAVAASMSA
jgi:hypothetical protein